MMKKNDDFSKLIIFLLCTSAIIVSFLINIVKFILFLILKPKLKLKPYNKINYEIDLEFAKIDEMDGLEFENFTSELLQKLNFKSVMITKSSGDFGVDVIAYKGDFKYAIQCKRYSTPVGVKAVQETISGQKFYKAAKSIVVTNSTFTKNAIHMATECNVELWDRTKLYKLVEQISKYSTNNKQDSCKNNHKEFNQINKGECNLEINTSGSGKKINTNKMDESQRTKNLSMILYQIKTIKSRESLYEAFSNENKISCLQPEKLSHENLKQPSNIIDDFKILVNISFKILGVFLILFGFCTLFIYFETGLFTIISGLLSMTMVINKINFIRDFSYGKLVVSKIILVGLFFLIAILLVPDN